MRRRTAPLLLSCALATGCGDDDSKPPVFVEPLVLDAGDAGPPEAGPDAQPDSATPDSSAPDAASPALLSASPCPAFDMPGAAYPLDALQALALTETQVFAASSDQLYVFERTGGCAGARLASLRLAVRSLGAGRGDSAVAGLDDSTVLVDGRGIVATCSERPALGLGMLPLLGTGFGVFGAAEVGRISVTASDPDAGPSDCGVQPVTLGGELFRVLAVAPELDQTSAIVGLRPTAQSAPVLQRVPDPLSEDLTGACSIRSIVHTWLGAAVLDPTCQTLRVYSIEGQTHAFPMPSGAVGRAISAVPGSLTHEISLATVSEPGAAPRLWVVGVEP